MSLPRLDGLIVLLAFGALPAWASTEEDLFFKSVADVNEGELRFLTEMPAKPVHHHQNRITIDDASLNSGWVHLEQCHRHLDPVPRTQVVFRQDFIRNLRLVRQDGIGRAWVEGPSVQLEDIGPDAILCIQADTLALSPWEAGGPVLRNGPYMRRFLDGYYPMRVSIQVHLATDQIRFAALSPAPQPGLDLNIQGQNIKLEAVFEGQLRTEMRFGPDGTAP
ncbi:MAG: hypothetical protein AB1421_10690 [Pseudomonadota bacterium]